MAKNIKEIVDLVVNMRLKGSLGMPRGPDVLTGQQINFIENEMGKAPLGKDEMKQALERYEEGLAEVRKQD